MNCQHIAYTNIISHSSPILRTLRIIKTQSPQNLARVNTDIEDFENNEDFALVYNFFTIVFAHEHLFSLQAKKIRPESSGG